MRYSFTVHVIELATKTFQSVFSIKSLSVVYKVAIFWRHLKFGCHPCFSAYIATERELATVNSDVFKISLYVTT